MSEERALAAVIDSGLEHEVTRHGRVGSLAEAAPGRVALRSAACGEASE